MKTIQVEGRLTFSALLAMFVLWTLVAVVIVGVAGAFVWDIIVGLGGGYRLGNGGVVAFCAGGVTAFWTGFFIARSPGRCMSLKNSNCNVVFSKITTFSFGSQEFLIVFWADDITKLRFYHDDVGIPSAVTKFIFLRKLDEFLHMHAEQGVFPIVLSPTTNSPEENTIEKAEAVART